MFLKTYFLIPSRKRKTKTAHKFKKTFSSLEKTTKQFHKLFCALQFLSLFIFPYFLVNFLWNKCWSKFKFFNFFQFSFFLWCKNRLQTNSIWIKFKWNNEQKPFYITIRQILMEKTSTKTEPFFKFPNFSSKSIKTQIISLCFC